MVVCGYGLFDQMSVFAKRRVMVKTRSDGTENQYGRGIDRDPLIGRCRYQDGECSSASDPSHFPAWDEKSPTVAVVVDSGSPTCPRPRHCTVRVRRPCPVPGEWSAVSEQ